jgi:hypothetical protein
MEIPSPEDLPADTTNLMPQRPGTTAPLPAGPGPVAMPTLADMASLPKLAPLPPSQQFNGICRTSSEVAPECEPGRIDMSALRSSSTPNPYTLNVHMTSLHYGSDGKNYSNKFNRANFGVAVERQLTDSVSVEAGYYKNSYKRDTLYAGVSYMPLQGKLGDVTVKAGAMVGVGTGYDHVAPKLSTQGLTAIAVGKITVDHKSGWGAGVTVLPPINAAAVGGPDGTQKKQGGIGAIGLSMRYKF